MVQAFLGHTYGDEVRVDYYDTSWPDPPPEVRRIIAEANERGLVYPVVAVDGKVRLHGSAEYWQIARMVADLRSGETAA